MVPTDGEGILFFDELTSAQPLRKTTAYQVTLDRRIGEYIVHDGFHIIPAGNNQPDRHGFIQYQPPYPTDGLAFPIVVSKLSLYLVYN
jgi:hypothetical protein